MKNFDPLKASAEARRRGLKPLAETQFIFGAAEAYGIWVPRPSLKYLNRRTEGFTWGKIVMETV